MTETMQKHLDQWRGRMEEARSEWTQERTKMDERERLYAGDHKMRAVTDQDQKSGKQLEARHVHNIILENIESEVSASIPQPKVTARREKDEALAVLIENMLRNELNRMPFERINQEQERTCPIQGAAAYLVEWDEEDAVPGCSGELAVSAQHPKRIIPQNGVTSGFEDMDWFFLEVPQTKQQIRRRYGVDVTAETETDQDVRGTGELKFAEDLVTQIICYYRNDDGGVGRFSWVGDTVLEDEDDWYARKLPVCKSCGATQSGFDWDELALPDYEAGADELPEPRTRGVCPECGGTEFERREQETERITAPIKTAHGHIIGGKLEPIEGLPELGLMMEPVEIPYYKPKKYPMILQKNLPVYGQLMGQSDVDSIKDQQNTLNRLDKKILDRVMKAGTRVTLPNKPEFRLDPEDGEAWRMENPADKAMIGAYDFKGDLEYELFYRANVEEQARKILGITEAFQGRQDGTAVSGVAKQFAAAQSAGRLESKRIYKDAAYADLFELMFQLKLAYADEKRPVVFQDERGNTVYDEFDRYDFLEQDETGKWVWNDNFLFSVDASAGLAANRQQMWQEITAAFQSGSFGDPAQTETLMLYWNKMELQHYPGAAETARYFKEKLDKEQQAAQMQLIAQQMQTQMMQQTPTTSEQAGVAPGGMTPTAL